MGLEYLYDKSGGRGQSSFHQWPEPSGTLERMGYAGGIGPDTIDNALKFVERYPEHRLWIDMENRVRTEDGYLDLDKVRQVCERTWPNVQG